MKCPKCKTIELSKRQFKDPLSCPDCGGVWVASNDIAKLSDIFQHTEPPLPSKGHESHDHQTGLCPNGHGLMLRARVDVEDPFYLERCTRCGGIWFDEGELSTLAHAHLFEHLTEFWTLSWQRKQREEKDRDAFVALNRKLLGDEVVDRIHDLASRLKDHPEKMRALALLRQEVI